MRVCFLERLGKLSRPLSSLPDLLFFGYANVFPLFRRHPSAHSRLSSAISTSLPPLLHSNLKSVGVSTEPPVDCARMYLNEAPTHDRRLKRITFGPVIDWSRIFPSSQGHPGVAIQRDRAPLPT